MWKKQRLNASIKTFGYSTPIRGWRGRGGEAAIRKRGGIKDRRRSAEGKGSEGGEE